MVARKLRRTHAAGCLAFCSRGERGFRQASQGGFVRGVALGLGLQGEDPNEEHAGWKEPHEQTGKL